jgi:hypothetical protein
VAGGRGGGGDGLGGGVTGLAVLEDCLAVKRVAVECVSTEDCGVLWLRGDGEGGDGGWMCRSRVGDGGLVCRAVTSVWAVVWAGPHGTAVREKGWPAVMILWMEGWAAVVRAYLGFTAGQRW